MPKELRVDANQDEYIMVLSNVREADGTLTGSLGDGEFWFHHDNCFVARPQRATALYCLENTLQEGGLTVFANGYAAYDSLPIHLKSAIEGRKVLQVYSYSVSERPDLSDLSKLKHHWQPAVIINPENGKRALYISRLMTTAIERYAKNESDKLLFEIYPYMERADYAHRWKPGDLIVWDNQFAAHSRTDFASDGRRRLKRIAVKGREVVAADSVQGARRRHA
jgi:taurine dioxygenase